VTRSCLTLAVLGVAAVAACQPAERKVPSPPSPSPQAAVTCPNHLAEATITLHKEKDTCRATVAPATVRVERGGVMRWFVDNQCGILEGSAERPALAVVRMTPKERGKAGWFEKACTASLPRVEEGSPLQTAAERRPTQRTNLIVCSIPNDKALEGVYEYSLEGKIETLDPRLEVIPPGP
jgi:hypothetical protein